MLFTEAVLLRSIATYKALKDKAISLELINLYLIRQFFPNSGHDFLSGEICQALNDKKGEFYDMQLSSDAAKISVNMA